MEAPIEIDPMELADIGQPLKIARELHRQLRLQFGSVPRKVPLAGIAAAVGIAGIKEFDTDQFEGTLVIQGGVGAIGLRRGLRSGRRNFTLGHELGHFLIPSHRFARETFQCASADINKRLSGGNLSARPQGERIELEANEFSAALLVPLQEFGVELRRLGRGCDISHVFTLADLFDVSGEMMTRVYVDNVGEKAAVIIAHNHVVKRIIPGPDFPYLGLRGGMPMPLPALDRAFRPAAGEATTSDLIEVPTDRWLERRGSVSALYEQVRIQQDGWSSTLLSVDDDDDDDA